MISKEKFIEIFEEERGKFIADGMSAKNVDDLLHVFARYSGKLEGMIMYIDIEVKRFK
jgi:hypothetical protein